MPNASSVSPVGVFFFSSSRLCHFPHVTSHIPGTRAHYCSSIAKPLRNLDHLITPLQRSFLICKIHTGTLTSGMRVRVLRVYSGAMPSSMWLIQLIISPLPSSSHLHPLLIVTLPHPPATLIIPEVSHSLYPDKFCCSSQPLLSHVTVSKLSSRPPRHHTWEGGPSAIKSLAHVNINPSLFTLVDRLISHPQTEST